jgi:hypothetical protein
MGRGDLTMRMSTRGLTHPNNAFSKKSKVLNSAIILHFTCDDFRSVLKSIR